MYSAMRPPLSINVHLHGAGCCLYSWRRVVLFARPLLHPPLFLATGGKAARTSCLVKNGGADTTLRWLRNNNEPSDDTQQTLSRTVPWLIILEEERPVLGNGGGEQTILLNTVPSCDSDDERQSH